MGTKRLLTLPPQYGDPFYRGRGRGRGRGRREWFTKRPIERPHGGLGRGFSHGNGREVNQVHTVRTQQERKEEEWSVPSNIERRKDERESHELPRAPPAPPPTEDWLFMDWSSIDSPRERTSFHSTSARNIVPNTNQPDNQTVQSGPVPARIEVMGNTLSDIMTFPSTCQQLNQVGTRLIGRETNTSDIEGRSQKGEMRIEDSNNDEVLITNNRNPLMPASHSGLSSYDTELTGGSHMRTCNTEMIPQLDGPMSVHSRRRILKNARAEPNDYPPPDILKNILHKIEKDIKPHARLKLCEDPETNIWSYYGTVKLTPIVLEDYLMLLLTVPLLDQSLHMNLYKEHNLPMLHLTLHVHAQYEIEGSYLAMVMDGMFITLPTALDVRLCLMTNGHLCMFNQALYPMEHMSWCIYALFINNKEQIEKNCLLKTIN